MSHNYSNMSNVGAGEKDPNVIREIVREIAQRSQGAREKLGWGALMERFHYFTDFEDPYADNDRNATLELDEAA